MLKKIRNFLFVPQAIYHYRNKSLKLPYMPAAIWIEPTNVCNLRCIMCPNSIVKQKNPGFMSWELYTRIIEEAQHFVAYIVFCISGESLLHPKLTEMIAYAKRRGIATYLSTNCTLLTPKISRKLLEAGLDWINFSFDGCTKETYEKVRVNAIFEKSLNNVVQFLKLKKKLNAKTQSELQILIMGEDGKKDYERNINKFKKNFENLPLDYIQIRQPSTWGGFLSKTDKYTPKKLGNTYSPCSYLWSSLHILWNGNIVACTSDFFGTNILGNFPKQTLVEIWNGSAMQKFRKAMVNKSYLKHNKYCASCDALWDQPILGLSSGIRGICAITMNTVLGFDTLRFFKTIAKFINPSFAMEVLTDNEKN